MPTTASGIPYPSSTDTPDVPRDVKAVADHLEARLPRASYAGTVSVPVVSANAASAAVTFPVGRFTGTPVVTVSTSGTSVWVAMSSAASGSGFTATVRHVDGSVATATPSVNWTATQN